MFQAGRLGDFSLPELLNIASQAYYNVAQSKSIIKTAFAVTGLYPIDKDQLISHLPPWARVDIRSAPTEPESPPVTMSRKLRSSSITAESSPAALVYQIATVVADRTGDDAVSVRPALIRNLTEELVRAGYGSQLGDAVACAAAEEIGRAYLGPLLLKRWEEQKLRKAKKDEFKVTSEMTFAC